MKSLDSRSDLPYDPSYGSNWGHKIANFVFLPYISFISVSRKAGYYGSRTVIVRVCRDFLVFNLQATFLLGFLSNFASGYLLFW